MDILLDHMLGRRVQTELTKQGHSVQRAFELGLHTSSIGDLYQKCIELDFVKDFIPNHIFQYSRTQSSSSIDSFVPCNHRKITLSA